MTSFASSLTLYTGVPLDNTYENTYTTTSLLNGFTHDTIGNSYYRIRPDKNTVKIEHSGNMNVTGIGGTTLNLYSCNYMSFINGQHENRRFYCFITDVRYISDYTAEIDFEIDVMMTWLKHTGQNSGCIFKECIVEREHTKTDNIGEHILPEPIAPQDYYYTKFDNSDFSNNIRIVCGVGGLYAGIWMSSFAGTSTSINNYYVSSGLTYYSFKSNGNKDPQDSSNPFTSIDDLVRSLYSAEKTDWLKQLYVCLDDIEDTLFVEAIQPTSFKEWYGGSVNEYTPKNKKLLCYPYNLCVVNDCCGGEYEYLYELGEKTSSLLPSLDSFEILFKCSANKFDPSLSIFPHKYGKGIETNIVTKTKFPIMSTSIDNFGTYKARLATQVGAELLTNVIGGSITGALIGGGPVTASVGAAFGLFNTYVNATSKYEQGSLISSTPNSNNSSISQLMTDTIIPVVYNKQIRIEQAKSLDDFFTKFGYNVSRLKTPSFANDQMRLNWKYIKTIGCALDGYAPATAMSKIEEIMDNGITFWKTKDVGDYTFPTQGGE